MREIATAALVLLSCSPVEILGETNCGMVVTRHWPEFTAGRVGFPDAGDIPWDMDKLNAAEAVAVRLLNDTKDERLHDACPKLRSVNLIITEKQAWYSDGRPAAGQTQCGNPAFGLLTKVMIGSNTPHQSSLLHELAHHLQDCAPRGAPDIEAYEDSAHAGWHRDGIFDQQGWFYAQLLMAGL